MTTSLTQGDNSSSINNSGAFLSALGLLLSLKHNFLKIAANQDEAVKKSQGMGGKLIYEGTCEAEIFQKQASKETIDELIGILIVIMGGFVSSYGEDLKNLIVSYFFGRQCIFEITGFLSILISCCLFIFSVPTIRFSTGSLLPHEVKEQTRFIQEFAKQQANKLLATYLLVFGSIVLMLAPFI